MRGHLVELGHDVVFLCRAVDADVRARKQPEQIRPAIIRDARSVWRKCEMYSHDTYWDWDADIIIPIAQQIDSIIVGRALDYWAPLAASYHPNNKAYQLHDALTKIVAKFNSAFSDVIGRCRTEDASSRQ